MVYIGYQQWRSKGVSFEQSNKKESILKLLLAGFIVGVTNPKTIIFYLSFLPIFVDLNNLTITTEVQVIGVYRVYRFLCAKFSQHIGP